MIRRRSNRLFAVLMAAALLSAGCAYFNSFYNTKKYFKDGEKKRGSTTTQAVRPQEYNKSIEAGSRLIEFYPESKYIDDTLYLMGQSYYWLGDYHKAQRKFEELQSNYPESPYFDDSRLWMGKVFVKLKKRQEATNTLRGLMSDTQDPLLVSGAQFAIAELYFDDSLFVKAEEQFLKVTELPGSDDVIGEAYWRAGDAAFREGRYEQATEYLRNALKHTLSKSLVIEVRLLYGKSLLKAGHPQKALNEFDSLLKDKRYFEYHDQVLIERAIAHREIGKKDEACAELQSVIDSSPRTEAAAQSYYLLGLWALKDEGAGRNSRGYLEKAKVERSRSFYSMKADTLLNQINQVQRLSNRRLRLDRRIQILENWIADPVNPADTTALIKKPYYSKTLFDSLKIIPLLSTAYSPDTSSTQDSLAQIMVFDPRSVLDSLAYDRVALQTTRFHLGELLLFDMGEQDSALTVFRELTQSSGIDSVRARAWLAIAYLHKMRGEQSQHDSLLTRIAEEYATTRFGTFALKKLGRENETKELVRPDEEAYREAVSLYVDKDQRPEAYSRFRWIIDRYPTSPLVVPSYYAAAFIAARDMGDIVTAEELLNQLAKEYPATLQGQQANLLLASLQAIRDKEMSDSLGTGMENNSTLSEEELDQKPVMVGGLESLSSVLDSRGLMPQEVLRGAGGDVLLRYIVHADGSASNFRVVLEDPPGRGLARALISGLQLMDYAPGLKNGKKVDARVEHRFSLPLDAPPNVRPLPKRR
ncbi:MAG: tetratricopeptide repeat protein [bacterium]